MEHLVFLYDIICYMVSFAAYLFAILTAISRGRKEEWAYVLFLTSFLLFFVPSLLNNYLFIVNSNNTGPLDNILRLSTIGGFGLMVFSLPRFVHAVTRFKRAKFVEFIFLAAAVVFSVLAAAFLGSPGEEPAFYILCGAMVASIAYSVIAGNISGRMKNENGQIRIIDLRWRKIMQTVTIYTVCLLPFSILLDMFPGLFPDFSALFPQRLKVFPLIYMLWNLIYVFNTLPLYIRKLSPAVSDGEWDFARFGLSRREREIALLIIEGLSYQEIADRLYISLATVKTHITRIYDKSGARNKMELANICRAPGRP